MSKQVHAKCFYDASYVRLVDHDGMLFSNVAFEDIMFEKCRFDNVAFAECLFARCRFIDCYFNSCSFVATRFDATLSEVSFRESHFLTCVFDASFLNVNIAHSTMNRCDFSRSEFTQLAMTEVVLYACNLPESIPVIPNVLDMVNGREFTPYSTIEVGRAHNYPQNGFDDYTWGAFLIAASDPFWKKRGG